MLVFNPLQNCAILARSSYITLDAYYMKRVRYSRTDLFCSVVISYSSAVFASSKSPYD
jgi:hypothetical protein